MERRIRGVAFATAMMAACLAAPVAFASGFEFTVPATNVGSGWGEWVAIADVNNDGRDDLLNLGPHDMDTFWIHSLYVRLQREDRTLAPPLAFAMPGVSFQSVEGVDLEGDGDNEIVAGFDGGVAIYRWNGTEFVPSVRNASVDCRHLAIADLDRNGTRDILCQSTQQLASIFLVDAAGEPGAPSYMQTMTAPDDSGSRQIELADVTGDGYPDLLSADRGVWAFFIYENDGGSGFLPPRAYAYPREFSGQTSGAIETIDADGDGTDDIVVAMGGNSPRSRLLVYRRDGHGGLQLWKMLATKDIPDRLLRYDVDADGRDDLLVAHRGWASIGRYMGTASGLSETERLTGNIIVGTLFAYLAAGDLDSDGHTDVATNNLSFQVSLKYGMGRPPGDLSANFLSDVTWRSAASGANTVWLDAGSNTAMELANVAAPWTIAAIADFDDDDKADLFWRNPNNGANMIWRSGNATTLQATVPAAAVWKLVGSGDFDGDAKADVLWRNSNSGANQLWLAARYDRAHTITAVPDKAWTVVGIGDFDGDRRDDLLWRNTTTGANIIWYSAASATSVSLATVTAMEWKVAGVGDFDGDAMDDILWRNAKTGANTIWRSANAARQMVVTAAAPAWTVAAIGDYRGDRKYDILWRNRTTGANVLWHDAMASRAATLTGASTAWEVVP